MTRYACDVVKGVKRQLEQKLYLECNNRAIWLSGSSTKHLIPEMCYQQNIYEKDIIPVLFDFIIDGGQGKTTGFFLN